MARGGGGTWMTGSYDPELGLLVLGNRQSESRLLRRRNALATTCTRLAARASMPTRANCVALPIHAARHARLGLEPRAGARDLTIGRPERQFVMVANRNGFFYVLDRTTGELLLGKPFTATTWAREIGADGRPIVLNEDGSGGCLPDAVGQHELHSAVVRSAAAVVLRERARNLRDVPPAAAAVRAGPEHGRRRVWADRDRAYGALRALDATTGELRWEFRYPKPNLAGVMSTASGLVFTGDNEGNFIAFDSATGEELWHYQTGTSIWGAARDDVHARRAPAGADSVGLRAVRVRAAELMVAPDAAPGERKVIRWFFGAFFLVAIAYVATTWFGLSHEKSQVGDRDNREDAPKKPAAK